MKKKIVILLTLYIIIKIFLNYKNIQTNVYVISLIFFKNIFPALFIFFIISNILINYGFIDILAKYFDKLFYYLFNINKYSTYVLIMSMLSGLPSNAKYIKELLDNKLINEKDAEHILLFSHFANPLFILFIGIDKPYLILIAHYIPNFIIGIFTRGINKNNCKDIKINNKDAKTLSNVLTESIINSINIIFTVLGLIIIFYTLSNLTNIFILKYILEMSSSITFIMNNYLTSKIKAMLITGILSFGGLCVHMQVISIINNKKIRYTPYLLARIIHFIISTLIIYFIY